MCYKIGRTYIIWPFIKTISFSDCFVYILTELSVTLYHNNHKYNTNLYTYGGYPIFKCV